MKTSLFYYLHLLLPMLLNASAPITIDGLFDDWALISPMHTDSSGDSSSEDFAEVKISNDNKFLFVCFSFHGEELLLQDVNEMRLFIDTDDDTSTGLMISGMGVDLEWCFGCRKGFYYTQGETDTLSHPDITLRGAPGVTANRFEIALALDSKPMTLDSSHTPATISLRLASSDTTDIVPDVSGGLLYEIDSTPVPPAETIPLERREEDHVRLLTYNTKRDGLFTDRQPYFERILKALSPDIIALQEQGDTPQVASLISSWLQIDPIYADTLSSFGIVISRYPILRQAILTTSNRSMCVLLDTEQALGSNLLLLNSHLACCGNDSSRQMDADELTMIMREWRTNNGPFMLPDNTPIVHLGDFNLVGSSTVLKTLTEGDIQDEDTYGSDFPPDWNKTALLDLISRHTTIRMTYTWRNDLARSSPFKLDYILCTDSNINIGNHFVLNTLAMSEQDLSAYGLNSEDTSIASDHLPRVADIGSIRPVAVNQRENAPIPNSS